MLLEKGDGIFVVVVDIPVAEMLQTPVYAPVRPLGLDQGSTKLSRPPVHQVREAAAPTGLAHVSGGNARREIAKTPHILCKKKNKKKLKNCL